MTTELQFAVIKDNITIKKEPPQAFARGGSFFEFIYSLAWRDFCAVRLCS